MRRKKNMNVIKNRRQKTSEGNLVRRSERIRQKEASLAEISDKYIKQLYERYQVIKINSDFEENLSYNFEKSIKQETVTVKISSFCDQRNNNPVKYTCAICCKKVRNIAVHVKNHSKEKIHSCCYCGRIVRFLSRLIPHIRTHTGVRPFRCTICWKAFSQKGSVGIHKLSHTGERPHVCKTCQKSFAEKGHLNRHILIHTGQKPYKCNLCGKAFNQTGSVKRHLASIHKQQEKS